MRMDTEEERMRAAENVLESYGVHELRRYARELGVPRPTQRKKAELIGEIVQAAFHGGERRIGRKGARCKARPHSQEELERFRQLVCGGPAGGAAPRKHLTEIYSQNQKKTASKEAEECRTKTSLCFGGRKNRTAVFNGTHHFNSTNLFGRDGQRVFVQNDKVGAFAGANRAFTLLFTDLKSR